MTRSELQQWAAARWQFKGNLATAQSMINFWIKRKEFLSSEEMICLEQAEQYLTKISLHWEESQVETRVEALKRQ